MRWERLLSGKRLGKPAADQPSTARTDFQRDFDRIVFSSAFRRLQDKTQVFPLSENDYVRTRLTHSLEAASVGRSLGTLAGERVLARHPELQSRLGPADFGGILAAACLAHDIGNPPFGHTGEDAIRYWFEHSSLGQACIAELQDEGQRQDFLRFEGNAQGFRIVTRLQSPDNRGGMQLTCATLATFTKYPSPSHARGGYVGAKKHGFFQDDLPLFGEVAEEVGLLPDGAGGWCRHPLAFLVEAADDICYRVIDLEDSFRLGLLGFEEVRELLMAVTGAAGVEARIEAMRDPKERVEYLRARTINQVIGQVTETFMDLEDEILAGRFNGELLAHIPCAAEVDRLLQVAMERIYHAPQVMEIEAAGFQVLGGLLEAFVPTVNDVARHGRQASSRSRVLLHLLPEQFVGPGRQPAPDLYRRLLGMTDFVSGMTDSYAVSFYKKMTGISLPGR